MMTFLLTILVLYLLYKATPWLLAWWVRRQHRKFQQQMGETRERETTSERQQARGERQERTSHIEDNAEDAEYQEIAGPRETVTQEAFTAEEQVIDAEFEDI